MLNLYAVLMYGYCSTSRLPRNLLPHRQHHHPLTQLPFTVANGHVFGMHVREPYWP